MELLLAGCGALGLTPDQVWAEKTKHGISLRSLYEALAKGWTPDSPVHPPDYELPKFDSVRIAEITRQLNEVAQREGETR